MCMFSALLKPMNSHFSRANWPVFIHHSVYFLILMSLMTFMGRGLSYIDRIILFGDGLSVYSGARVSASWSLRVVLGCYSFNFGRT